MAFHELPRLSLLLFMLTPFFLLSNCYPGCASVLGRGIENAILDQRDFENLSSAFDADPDIILLEGSRAYNSELQNFWNLGNGEILPQIMVRPRNAKEASLAVKILAASNYEFGVRSGGHMPNKGCNNSPQVLLATTLLNTITFPSAGIASLGAGLRWGAVYKTLLEQGVTTVGGRFEAVGVSGLLLGGGISHLSNEYGFAVDNVVNFEVVLASGEIVNANSTSNADLFWALKGGGNNFGLVTRFDVKTVPQNVVWGGIITISGQELKSTLDALYHWQLGGQVSGIESAVEILLLRGPLFHSINDTLVRVSVYHGAPVEDPESLRVFTKIPSLQSTLRLTTHFELAKELAVGNTNTKRHAFYTGSYKSTAELNLAVHDIYFSMLGSFDVFSNDTAAYTALSLQPISETMLAKGHEQHPMNIDPAGAPYIWYNFHVEYTDISLESRIFSCFQDAHAAIQAEAESVGKADKYIFLNDAGSDQSVFSSYGEDSLQKLKSVSAKYDPNQVFQRLVRGGFKIEPVC